MGFRDGGRALLGHLAVEPFEEAKDVDDCELGGLEGVACGQVAPKR